MFADVFTLAILPASNLPAFYVAGSKEIIIIMTRLRFDCKAYIKPISRRYPGGMFI